MRTRVESMRGSSRASSCFQGEPIIAPTRATTHSADHASPFSPAIDPQVQLRSASSKALKAKPAFVAKASFTVNAAAVSHSYPFRD